MSFRVLRYLAKPNCFHQSRAHFASSAKSASIKQSAQSSTETDSRIKILVSELAELKESLEAQEQLRLKAEQSLAISNTEKTNLARDSDSRIRALELQLAVARDSHSLPSADQEKLIAEVREELDGWKNAAEEYLANARDFETRLRDAQVKHREDEMEWQGRVLEAKQTGTLPLLIAMFSSASLTFLIYHGKTLLDHRKNLLVINEREREWLDQQSELVRKYEDSLTEISRLRSVQTAQKKWYW